MTCEPEGWEPRQFAEIVRQLRDVPAGLNPIKALRVCLPQPGLQVACFDGRKEEEDCRSKGRPRRWQR